jgi:cell division protein FtsB
MSAQDNYIDDVITRLQDQVEKQAAEIERLKADNNWLRKLIHDATAAQDYNEARRALEGK